MAVANWSTTAALNVESTGISGTGGGVGIQGTNLPSNFDDALRQIMAQLATFFTSATFTGTTPLILTSTDASAAAGPILTFYRNSATPAAADIAGKILFQGEDSAGNTEDYAEIYQVIDDPLSTSEDASLLFRTKIAGTMTTGISLGATMTVTPATTFSGAVTFSSSTNRPVMATSQATTSGTTIDFTSIPSGVKRITVSMAGVSTNGTSVQLLQIGDSGGIENTGYLCSLISHVSGNVNSGANTTTGFGWGLAAAAAVQHGSLVLTLIDASTNTWACAGVVGYSNAATTASTAGSKPLSATLDRIRLTMTNGTDTFDAGLANIMYEY